ncbi:mitochondrial chaperone BCS1-like [Paramacrobiotus metropolitanus]|uniref:mitochondrial chaperone BCS1-like n=1 Tax=Paramacrobiotus metropolitanus TaxID=2943436 RepID=UPI002445D511|nr:mitochondrial chaperone BCS1-like [Paramacrobiotus metropolitanus]
MDAGRPFTISFPVWAVGTHVFRFKDKKITAKRDREDKGLSDRHKEELNLSTNDCSTDIYRDIIADVKAFHKQRTLGCTLLYINEGGYWSPTSDSGKRKRPLDSIHLADGISEAIIADIQEFFDTAEWYADYGVPYRRGYLFHGPPGTGKTSFISAVAGHFDLDICAVNLSDSMMTDEMLRRLMYDAPENSVILLEDVDAAFGDRGEWETEASEEAKERKPTKKGKGKKKTNSSAVKHKVNHNLTLSGLLNAVDGVGSAEGRIIFMTTNYVERLDAALIRPGRIDYRQLFDYATKYQVESMFRRFHRQCTDDEAQTFVQAVFGQLERPQISMAKLQGLFLRHKNRPADVVLSVSLLHE